ncbi:MAG: hemolysin family protein [Hylemonella sp.]
MSLTHSLLLIAVLIATSAFFSMAELALAASRRLRLQQLADDGDARAAAVLQTQTEPGHYFTVVQIGQNAVAILGGIVGEGALGPPLQRLLAHWLPEPYAATTGFLLSFAVVTSLFIVFSDLFPKRLAMVEPERLALRLHRPMRVCMVLFKPVVWLYSRLTDGLFRLLGLPMQRDERVTPDDILALAEAGAEAGVLDPGEQQVIANLFELDTRTVSSAMTARDRIAWFDRHDSDAIVRARIAAEPYSTYPVCDGDIDHVIGYVDAKDLFQRVMNNQPIRLDDPALLRKVVVVPDRLTLAEVLEQFRQAREDFAVIVNEYSLVVGVVTLNDVMSTVMGDLVPPAAEALIVQREEGSWLIDGITPMAEVQRALDLDELPQPQDYDTLAGFLMVMLRRVPRRTDRVHWGGYSFEVIDVDAYRIDQVMVTRLPAESAAQPCDNAG